MSVAGPQMTPQRPLPGQYIQTPAPNREQPPPRMSIFNRTSSSATQVLRQNAPQSSEQAMQSQSNTSGTGAAGQTPELKPVVRAARTINETLAAEGRFPEMESYITQGISSEYDLPESPAWFPFQKVKTYELPERILEQANHGEMYLQLGLFAELNHAWMVADSSLYLWDYTHPNPELIGFEEQGHPITAVKLVIPRKGVFIEAITHMLVVATTTEMILIGLATQDGPSGSKTITLYNTRMSTPIKGLHVNCIDASKKSGRVFFTSNNSDDVYELLYKQDENWFSGKCSKKCHTSKSYIDTIIPAFGPKPPASYITQLVIDDTRNLLYTLSSRSEIKTYAMRVDLYEALVRPFQSLIANTGYMLQGKTELLHSQGVHLVSISSIPATEASKLSLMATTSTGCRLYLSAIRNYGAADDKNPPTSMQILHIRFPPKDSTAQAPAPQTQQVTYQHPAAGVDITSKLLTPTANAVRLPPGYFLCFVPESPTSVQLKMFISAPDSGRIKNPHETAQLSRYVEFGQWIKPFNKIQQIETVTRAFGAAATPLGFGNELAVQFDQPAMEIAIMTTTGIQTVRRRRLVDVFAALIRYRGDDEGLENDIKRFVRQYGRGETAATALAVACGQGIDVTPDARVANITDPEVVEQARKAFIEQGGKAELNVNSVLDNNSSAIDNVRPSPRHEGMALYVSRLVRSIWKSPIIKETFTPIGGLKVEPSVNLEKLRSIQRDLNSLSEFLAKNKTFIEGLSGPEALGRVSTKQEEVALQGEARAMDSLVKLISSIVEGIAFVLVLFDEKVDEILMVLTEQPKQKARALTYEGLFCSQDGKELAKELVKAIVNRNIVNGSNVDTVAEALRRRCGSFCSADDVVIFKAQEQVKRASEAGPTSETGRMLLNESQRLFQKVAASLTMEQMQWAVEQYIQMSFYAGAIQLALVKAQEADRANRALSWLNEGSPDMDKRKEAFDDRKKCYDLVFATINAVDQSALDAPELVDGQYTVHAKRRSEAYDLINSSEDKVFLNTLYDWYMSQGWSDRLLEAESPYVIHYLKRKSANDQAHADLLWRYYAHHNNFFEAAMVQKDLAVGFFDLNLEARIGYLSRARTNASTRQTILLDSRQTRQQLLREVSDLLDVANIQDDILQRMKAEPRLTGERRAEVLEKLDGPIHDVGDLFNQYADQAGYHDICLLIYQVADHRNPSDIKTTWDNLIVKTHNEAGALGQLQPYEAVSEIVREVGRRVNVADAIFPINALLPMLERYAFEQQRGVGPATWVIDLVIDLEVPYESLVPALESYYYSNEQPFTQRNRKILAGDLVYLLGKWFLESERNGERVPFGSEEVVGNVQSILETLQRSDDLDNTRRQEAQVLTARITQSMA